MSDTWNCSSNFSQLLGSHTTAQSWFNPTLKLVITSLLNLPILQLCSLHFTGLSTKGKGFRIKINHHFFPSEMYPHLLHRILRHLTELVKMFLFLFFVFCSIQKNFEGYSCIIYVPMRNIFMKNIQIYKIDEAVQWPAEEGLKHCLHRWRTVKSAGPGKVKDQNFSTEPLEEMYTQIEENISVTLRKKPGVTKNNK